MRTVYLEIYKWRMYVFFIRFEETKNPVIFDKKVGDF